MIVSGASFPSAPPVTSSSWRHRASRPVRRLSPNPEPQGSRPAATKSTAGEPEVAHLSSRSLPLRHVSMTSVAHLFRGLRPGDDSDEFISHGSNTDETQIGIRNFCISSVFNLCFIRGRVLIFRRTKAALGRSLCAPWPSRAAPADWRPRIVWSLHRSGRERCCVT